MQQLLALVEPAIAVFSHSDMRKKYSLSDTAVNHSTPSISRNGRIGRTNHPVAELQG
jgi:hypothetical protein